MIPKLNYLLTFLFLLTFSCLFSQTITGIDQEDINSVGQDVSNLTIHVDGVISGNTYDIYVLLSNQGIELVNSGTNLITATGGTIGTISGTLAEPIIQVTATGSSFSLVVPRMANCTAYDLLSSGSAVAYNDQAKIGAGGTLFIPSSNYQVNYASLSIPNITDNLGGITPSATVTRTVNIVQGLPSSLSSFQVEIVDLDGVLAFSNIVLVGSSSAAIPLAQITNSADTTIVEITSVDLLAANFGNGDGFMDLNEGVSLQYDFTIDTGCPSGNNITVGHMAYWGVEGITSPSDNCQNNSRNKVISFNEELPNLRVNISSTTPDTCIGYGAGFVEHTITFENTGNANLLDLSFELLGDHVDFSVFDVASITYDLDGAGPVAFVPTSTTDLLDGAGCFSSIPGTSDYKNIAQMDLPIDIPAGSILEVVVRTYSCCPTTCVNEYNAHDFRINAITYEEICGGILSESDELVSISSMEWNSLLTTPSNFFVSSPVQYAYIDIYTADLTQILLGEGALFELEVTLPDRIDLGNSGTASEIQWNGGLTNPGSPVFSNITDNAFTMKWSATSEDFKNGQIVFPLILDCSETAGSNDMTINLSIIPEVGCPSGDCQLSVLCENVSVAIACPGPCPVGGVNHLNYSFYRSNIDPADADNNGCPDTDNDCDGILSGVDTDEVAAPSYDPSLVRNTRALEGDTIISDVEAVVVVGTAGEFRRLQIIDNFDNNSNRNKFNPIGADIYYYDLSTGNDYSATLSPILNSGVYRYDIRPSDFGLSNTFGGHRFQDGDTLRAKIKYVLRDYSTLSSINRSVNNNVYGITGTAFNDPSVKYSCSTFAGVISHFSILVYTQNTSNVTINGCGTADIIGDIKFDVGRTNGVQYFPYEYRRIGYIDSFAIRIFDTYEYLGAGITISRYNYEYLDTTTVIPTNIIAGVGYSDFIFDLNDPLNSHVFSDNGGMVFPGDETYVFGLVVNVRPLCEVNNNITEDFDPLDEITNARAIKEQYFEGNPNIVIRNVARRVRSRIADLNISSLSQVEPFTTNDMVWNIDVTNVSNNGAADEVWAVVEAPGSIDVSTVHLNLDNGGVLTPIVANANNIFELGSIGTDETKSFLLGADVFACSVDSLVFYVGMRCQGYPSSIADAKSKCNEQFTVYVQPETAQVSSVITSLASTPDPEDGTTLYGSSEIDMCAPFPVEIQIISGQLEPINNLHLRVPSLASGLDFVSGSGYIWYDRNGDGTLDADGADDVDDGGTNDDERIPFDSTEDAALSAINGTGDPFLMDIEALVSGSGLFDWSLGQYLPGVKEIPQNILYVRFEMLSTCNLVVGKPIKSRIFADKALCGGKAIGNGELRSGYNLNVTGLTAPYLASEIGISSNNINSCGGVQPLDFSFRKDGTNATHPNDSITVFLPTGLIYNSFGSNLGDKSVSNTPVISSDETGQFLKWQVPSTLVDTETVHFSINVSSDSYECTNYEVGIEVAITTSVSCGASTCSEIKIFAGEDKGDVNVDLPIFDLSLNSLNVVSSTEYNGNFDVSNIGGSDFTDNLSVEIYQYDGLGGITGSVLSTIDAGSLNSGSSSSINFNLSTTEDISLGIVAIIPNVNDNCYCGMPDVASRNMFELPSSVITPTLPIELISFKAKTIDCETILEWETAKEDNFSHFEIYRIAENSSEKELIGTIQGRYNNGGNYEFIDDLKRFNGKYYYQLKNIDLDESFEYSNIISTEVNCGNSELIISPNPVRKNQSIMIAFFTNKETEFIQIFNSKGQLVKSVSIQTSIGETNSLNINLNELSTGMYFVNTSSGQSSKFIIK